MKYKLIVLLIVSVFWGCTKSTDTSKKYSKWMTDSEMQRNPESWMLDFSKAPKWNYCHGLVLQAILQVWDKTEEEKYFDYAYSYANLMIDENANIKTYKITEYNIDRVNPGKILFPLYKETKENRFKNAIDTLRTQMETHPRTADGSYWHKKVYPHQVWLDGIYMASPFLAEYAMTYNKPEMFNDVALQILDAHKYLYDSISGLYYHGWDESRQQKWANQKTGVSPHFWSRSIGWYMLAMVDVLDFLPIDHPQRIEIINVLKNLATSIEKYRDKDSGMWYQVTNLGDREGNYLESTGSAMFLYSWIKGAQKGYLPAEFLEKGATGYQQYLTQFVREEQDNTISITNCCAVAGLGGDKNYRDGSFEYYISEPIRDNDPKAVGPFIMLSLLLDK